MRTKKKFEKKSIVKHVSWLSVIFFIAGCGSSPPRVHLQERSYEEYCANQDCEKSEVEGVVIARPADPERAAHFASEAANPDAMPENAGAEMLYEINATGVRIKNG